MLSWTSPSIYRSREHIVLLTDSLNIIFFVLLGFEVLGELDSLSLDKESIIKWVYTLQIKQKHEGVEVCGFVGSKNLMDEVSCFDNIHITMTYVAIVILIVLDSDLSKLNRIKILETVRKLQNENGSFNATFNSLEIDIRFTYSAIAVCYLLGGLDYINIKLAIKYILSCQVNISIDL